MLTITAYCCLFPSSKHQNTIGFLMFYDSMKRQRCDVMGKKRLFKKRRWKVMFKKDYVQKYWYKYDIFKYKNML